MAAGRKQERAPSECPVCGAEIPPRAHACPECGADERTGWNEETTRYDDLNLPDESFNEGAAEKDQEIRRGTAPGGASVFWWLVGVAMIAVLIYLVARRAW